MQLVKYHDGKLSVLPPTVKYNMLISISIVPQKL